MRIAWAAFHDRRTELWRSRLVPRGRHDADVQGPEQWKRFGMVRGEADEPAEGHEQRNDILNTLSVALRDPTGALFGIDPILDRQGYSRRQVVSVFGSVEEFLVLITKRKAAFLSTPFTECALITDLEFARRVLTDFGTLAWDEYSTSIIALVRLMMAEGARSPDLRRRVYEAGPVSVACKLRQFFSKAHEDGVLTIPEPRLAAEQLLGILREPLYQALMLNPAPPPAADEEGPVAASIKLVLNGCMRLQAL